jgi:hypothetical protein
LKNLKDLIDLRMRYSITFGLKTKYLVLLIAIVPFGCKKENLCDCVKGTGEQVMETREISGFKRLHVEDHINVFITEDPQFSVKVSAGKHLIKLVKTELDGDELNIRNDNKCNSLRSYKKSINVYIHMPVLKYILHDGSGRIESINTITTDTFDLRTRSSGDIELSINNGKLLTHLGGTGDMILSGFTGEHACYATGNGFIHAERLNTGYTWIFSNTTGNAYLDASNLLIVLLHSTGDVYYKPTPSTIQSTVTGTGQLLPY